MECHKYKNTKIKLSRNSQRGFSIIEVIIVVGIMTLLFSVSDSVYTSFKSSSNLDIATGSLVEALRYSKTNSEIMKGDSKWGVKIFADHLVIFKGDSYTARDTGYDQSINFPSGVVASGTGELTFEKMTGVPVNTGTIDIVNNSGTKNILINEKGTITY
jgi:prepilin-type N-terminal cleavage/methylation domain-containing protein